MLLASILASFWNPFGIHFRYFFGIVFLCFFECLFSDFGPKMVAKRCRSRSGVAPFRSLFAPFWRLERSKNASALQPRFFIDVVTIWAATWLIFYWFWHDMFLYFAICFASISYPFRKRKNMKTLPGYSPATQLHLQLLNDFGKHLSKLRVLWHQFLLKVKRGQDLPALSIELSPAQAREPTSVAMCTK